MKSLLVLGVILDSKMLFSHNINNNVSKGKKAVAALYPLHRKHSHVPVQSKLTIYKMFIGPILTYACPAYSHAAACHLKKLQFQQNKVLRMELSKV
jgi:hypothetical protein